MMGQTIPQSSNITKVVWPSMEILIWELIGRMLRCRHQIWCDARFDEGPEGAASSLTLDMVFLTFTPI